MASFVSSGHTTVGEQSSTIHVASVIKNVSLVPVFRESEVEAYFAAFERRCSSLAEGTVGSPTAM